MSKQLSLFDDEPIPEITITGKKRKRTYESADRSAKTVKKDWADEVNPELNTIYDYIPDPPVIDPHESMGDDAAQAEADYRAERVETYRRRFECKQPFFHQNDGGRLPTIDILTALI